MKLIKFLTIISFMCIIQCVFAQEKAKVAAAEILLPYQFPVNGIVFEDKNANGKIDADEKGLPNIPVSDGNTIIITEKNGSFRFENADKKIKNVFVCVPDGFEKKKNFFKTLINEKENIKVEIPLTVMPPESGREFSFVQITDIHVNTKNDVKQLQDSLAELDEIDVKPDFIIATGDLVGKGDERLKLYADGISTYTIPIFNIPGNHDTCKSEDTMINFNKYIGPDYFSFTHGNYHFLFTNSTSKNPAQEKWIKEDIEKLAGDNQIIILRHYQPFEETLNKYAEFGVDAVFSGHWHSNKIYTYKDIRVINTPCFSFGGVDLSPSGFRMVKFSDSGFTTEYRANGVRDFCRIVYPPAGYEIEPWKSRNVIVNAYDTRKKIKKMTAVFKSGDKDISFELEKKSELTWFSKNTLGELSAGKYSVSIIAEPPFDTALSPHEFSINIRGDSVSRAALEPSDHLSFMEGPERKGVASSALNPPLELVWVYPSGGTIDFSSPAVKDGNVFIGIKERNGGELSGVLGINAKDGTKLWFAKTGSPVNGSPEIFDNAIIAQEMGGTVHAFDLQTGKEKWNYVCGNKDERWIFGAPAVRDGKVFTGSSKWLAALDAQTGRELWVNKEGDDWISCLASISASDKYVLCGSIWIKKNDKWYGNYAVDINTGKTSWVLNSTGSHGAAMIDRDFLYCNDITGRFIIGDMKNGDIKWEYKMFDKGKVHWSPVTPAKKDNLVITGSSNGTVFCFDVEKREKVWEFKSGQSVFRCSAYDIDKRALLSSPAISGNIVYIGSGDGNLYALDLKTGKEKWRYDFGVPVLSTPSVCGDYLYAAAYDGNIYAFRKMAWTHY